MGEGTLQLLWDAHRARKRGPDAIKERQRIRFQEMVSFARANSPYYGELYRNLPETIADPRVLPVTNKRSLMSRFDDWVTDRKVSIEKVRAFVSDPKLIGERFLGRYLVASTSGTTGTPGIFLVDNRTLVVTSALAVRMVRSWLGIGDVFRILADRGRIAMVMATGGHFASAVAAARLRKSSERRARSIRALSVHMPLPEIVAQLNEFRPVVVAPYASMAALLASEQEAGRLHINPVLMVLSAEGLPEREYQRIAKAFHCKVGNSYAATECTFLSYSCEEGWLHVNADWVLLEPVDANFEPTPAGKQSHTVLLSNLANRTQPILRYDLGDSVLERPDLCPCGSPLPAIRVQGRAADVLVFNAEDGAPVSIPPLALELDDVSGVELFQVIQTAPAKLRVRLKVAEGANRERVWSEINSKLTRLLSDRRLGHVALELAEEPPEQSAGGKYRTVIPFMK